MNKKAFTLLELIIVIIVLGVLTSLGLPRMFAVIAKVKATEAINSLSLIDKGIQACIEYGRSTGASTGVVDVCYSYYTSQNYQALGINNPQTEISSNFNFFPSFVTTDINSFDYRYLLWCRNKDDPSDVVYFLRANNYASSFVPCGGPGAVNHGADGIFIRGCGAFESLNISQ